MESLRAFVYDRTSHVGTGRSTGNADQAVENDRFCERQGWVIAERFTDAGKSASRHSRAKRTDFERMVDGISRGGCDVLVVWEASRAYRDLEIYVRLRKLCVENRVLLCYNGRVYDLTRREDRFSTGFDALRAEDEAEAIRDRNLRTVRLNAERGRPHGRLPYGYRRVYDERTGALIEQVPDEAQAPIVREVGRRIAGGESLYGIAKDLNKRGVASPAGGEWSPQGLPEFISKPTYIGQRVHGGRVVGDAKWPAILDEETYYACIQLFADPERARVASSAVKYLLVGIARCGLCGAGLSVQLKARKPSRVYLCMGCFKVSINGDLFEEYVVTLLVKRIGTREFAESLRRDPDTEGTRAALAEAQAIEAQLAKARELAGRWENGRILLSAVSLAKMEQELMPRIEDARARAQSVSVPHALREVAGPGAQEKWDGQDDLGWRRTLIRSAVVARLFPAGKGVRTIKPGRVVMDWLY